MVSMSRRNDYNKKTWGGIHVIQEQWGVFKTADTTADLGCKHLAAII